MTVTPLDVPARILRNRQVFERLIGEAARDVEQSDYRNAAATLQTAGRFAWFNYPGQYQSPELEALAREIGAQITPLSPLVTGPRIDVLHILSRADSKGGHTKLVWRWIENDSRRVHSIVVTQQRGHPVPIELQGAVRQSGGRILQLSLTSSNLVKRAAQLRSIASGQVGVVVLHTDPCDVIPSIGLADINKPVILLNHADHVFWIGAGAATFLADIRPAGRKLSLDRRAFSANDTAILPIPLKNPPTVDRDVARTMLGIPNEKVVVLSIASSYKYSATTPHHFIDVHKDFVRANPNVQIIVVGPDDIGDWRAINEQTDGRFRAIGTVNNLEIYYAAADIYVDSFPFGSLTSLLDAGIRGIPVLGFSESVAHSVLTSDDISLPGNTAQFSSKSEYIRELGRLVHSPEHRHSVATDCLEAIQADHLTPGWNAHLELLYGAAHEHPKASRHVTRANEPNTREPDAVEQALVRLDEESGLSVPLRESQLRDAPYMSPLKRARVVLSAPPGNRLKSFLFILPDSLISRARQVLNITTCLR